MQRQLGGLLGRLQLMEEENDRLRGDLYQARMQVAGSERPQIPQGAVVTSGSQTASLMGLGERHGHPAGASGLPGSAGENRGGLSDLLGSHGGYPGDNGVLGGVPPPPPVPQPLATTSGSGLFLEARRPKNLFIAYKFFCS